MRQRIYSPRHLSSLSSSFEDHHEQLPVRNFITLRGRQLFKEPKRIYQDINISKNSTCETKPMALQRNMKAKKLPNTRKLGVRARNKPTLSETKSNSSSSSRERLKRRFCENDFITYPTKKEFGLSSSEDEMSSDMQNPLKANLSNEIESILIDIYNKNISSERKRKRRLNKREQELKSSFKEFDEHYNVLILQILSTQIKELIHKYKEKIFEIPKMNQIRQKYLQEKKQQLGLASLNLTLPSLPPFKLNSNTLMVQMQNELTEQGIAKILLKELINIKRTLKKSSVEIENIFQYPLSLIEQSAKSKFSIEQMQIEEYSKVLLNDELISGLLLEFKIIFSQIKSQDVIDLIDLAEEDKIILPSEFTRFDKAINGRVNFALIKEEKSRQKDYFNEKAHKPRSPSSNETAAKKSEPVIADIDELLKFIDSDNNDKKKKKRRNKKNKKPSCEETNVDSKEDLQENSNTNCNTPHSNCPTLAVCLEINEQEIENFKTIISESTQLSCLCQKEKPKISQQWLNNLINKTIMNKLNKNNNYYH